MPFQRISGETSDYVDDVKWQSIDNDHDDVIACLVEMWRSVSCPTRMRQRERPRQEEKPEFRLPQRSVGVHCIYTAALSGREWPSSPLPVSVTRIRLARRAIPFKGLLSRRGFAAEDSCDGVEGGLESPRTSRQDPLLFYFISFYFFALYPLRTCRGCVRERCSKSVI